MENVKVQDGYFIQDPVTGETIGPMKREQLFIKGFTAGTLIKSANGN